MVIIVSEFMGFTKRNSKCSKTEKENKVMNNKIMYTVVKTKTTDWILNGEKEFSTCSLQNLESVNGLEEKSIEKFQRNEEIEIARLILEEAFKQLTSREIYLINAIYFEQYDISEIAVIEQTYKNEIKRELKKSLEHLKIILGQMNIHQMSDVI